jgi:hypothetical protein
MVDKEGGMNMEDAAGFFANVFGGERFVDYVRPSTYNNLVDSWIDVPCRLAKFQS